MDERSDKRALRTLTVVMLDLVILAGCAGLAVYTRFGFSFEEIPQVYIDQLARFLPLQAGTPRAARRRCRFYGEKTWR